MDQMEPNQPSHSSYRRDWGHPYQRGPVNPYQMALGPPHPWGLWNPNQSSLQDVYQKSLGHNYQRKLGKPIIRPKKLTKDTRSNAVTLNTDNKMLDLAPMITETKKLHECTRCQMEFKNQVSFDEHISSHKHKRRQLANEILEQLQKTEPCFTHDSVENKFVCQACNINIKSAHELEHHFYGNGHIAKAKLYRAGVVKSLPLRSDSTPCQYINPYLKADTCLSGVHSSKFWLDLIEKVYVNLSPSNKKLFIEDMISQVHGSLHKGYHKKIVSEMYNKSNCDTKMVIKLQKAYYKKNMTFNCTCGSGITQEELDEVRGITATNFHLEYEKPFQPIENPYLSETTCEGSEKSSLFWLSKIEEEFHDLSFKKQKKYVTNMITQAHACLHKDYHNAIIELLSGNMKRDDHCIDKLRVEYEILNNDFVCTCETGKTQKVLQTGIAKESCVEFNTTEPNKELTYESILGILELDD